MADVAADAADRAAPARDAVSVLITVGILLLLVPARLVFGGAGIATPATVAALACGWFWVMGRLVASLGSARGRQPVRVGLALYGLAVTASFAAAASLSLERDQAQAADRGMVVTVAMIGLALLAADGIRSRERLDALLKTLVACGSLVAVVGILQFVMRWDLAAMVRIPGLSGIQNGYDTITNRADFNRVAGTTLHPIEFSAVLTMTLPLALHYAFTIRARRWTVAAALIAVAIPMSVSRTAAVVLAAVALVLVPTWPREWRRRAALAACALAVTMKALVPGLLGTIRALIFAYGADPSIASRQRGRGEVWHYIGQHPLFGRGYGTFIPQRFFFLDDQYLLTLVETGIAGLVALVLLFAIAIHVARAARRASRTLVDRNLAQSLVASLVATLVACATFDFLSFPTARGLAFLLIGACGALWRLQVQGAPLPVATAVRA